MISKVAYKKNKFGKIVVFQYRYTAVINMDTKMALLH